MRIKEVIDIKKETVNEEKTKVALGNLEKELRRSEEFISTFHLKSIEFSDWIDMLVRYVNELQSEYEQMKNKLESFNKDEEIQQAKQETKETIKMCSRGFPLTEEEYINICNWKEKHEKKFHRGSSYAGAIGGRYSYTFTPTAIGDIGIIKCICGKEFKFSDLS